MMGVDVGAHTLGTNDIDVTVGVVVCTSGVTIGVMVGTLGVTVGVAIDIIAIGRASPRVTGINQGTDVMTPGSGRHGEPSR